MECPNCGGDLQAGKRYCIRCGQRVPVAPSSASEELIASFRDVFTERGEGPWLRKLLWGTGMIGTLALTSRRLVFIHSKIGLERFAGGPKVDNLAQMEELLASHGGFAIPRAEVQTAWVSATGFRGPPSGRGDFADLTIRLAANRDRCFRFYGALRSECLAAAEQLKSLLAAPGGDASGDAYRQIMGEMDPQLATMESTLRELGLSLDFSSTDPQTAFIGGFAKATLVKGHQALSAGNVDEAITAFTTVIDRLNQQDSDQFVKSLAVVYSLRGIAHEGKRQTAQALADYAAALDAVPNHAVAREGQRRLSGRA
jgi:hypothetical protein